MEEKERVGWRETGAASVQGAWQLLLTIIIVALLNREPGVLMMAGAVAARIDPQARRSMAMRIGG